MFLAAPPSVGARLSWTNLHHIGDPDVGTRKSGLLQRVVQQLAGPTDERPALLLLVRARRLADQHKGRQRVAVSENEPGIISDFGYLRRPLDLTRELIQLAPTRFRPFLLSRHASPRIQSKATIP